MPTKKNDLEFERDFAKLLREIDSYKTYFIWSKIE